MNILWMWWILTCWSVVAFVPSFHDPFRRIRRIRHSVPCSFNSEPIVPFTHCLFSKKSNNYNEEHNDGDADDDDDDDDEEYIDEQSLGDWRSFRATLVGSSSSIISSSVPEDGLLLDDNEEQTSIINDINDDDNNNGNMKNDDASPSETTKDNTRPTRPKSVSKENEDLLRSQSDILAEEYKGIWCHEVTLPEIGGLVVRLPLEAEIFKNKDKLSLLGKDLTRSLDDNNGEDGPSNLSTTWTKDANDTTDDNEIDDSDINDSFFSIITVQTIYWYRKTQRMIQGKMKKIASLADGNGTIDPRQLAPQDETLLNLYVDNQSTWQEVCLVVERDEEGGTAQTLVLNRPMAFSLSENLAKLVLFGSYGGMVMGSTPVSQTNRYLKFLRAFESSCAVYVGGPDKMSEPAILIHGFSDLEGSKEISPGTGIYQGGLDAAIDGVLSGKYNALDFRFFVGRHEYTNGDLDVNIFSNKYQAVACARALALKQCIQLPKPLWHEVMELCGGELSEISRLEFQKRTDLK